MYNALLAPHPQPDVHSRSCIKCQSLFFFYKLAPATQNYRKVLFRVAGRGN